MSVVRQQGMVNAGEGRESSFAVRYVVDGRPRIRVDASSAAIAAGRAAMLVRARRPRAVWLRDDRSPAVAFGTTAPWRPLARAARDVHAAFVAWRGSGQYV